jgi:putative FmdB family regulatory protein
MPIYEYECLKCGDEFDAIQSFSDKPLEKCSKCGGSLRKKISECSFHLKGSGWYVTDYGKKDQTNNKKAYDEKHKKAGSEKKDSTSSCASPAADSK